MNTVVVEYRGEKPPSMNARMHYRKKTAIRERWEMLLRSKYPGLKVPTPARLTFTVYTSILMDWDNAVSLMKIPMDALQNIGALENDGPKFIVDLKPRQEKCPRKDVGFRMEFEEVAP